MNITKNLKHHVLLSLVLTLIDFLMISVFKNHSAVCLLFTKIFFYCSVGWNEYEDKKNIIDASFSGYMQILFITAFEISAVTMLKLFFRV